jgi:hypothetical protein
MAAVLARGETGTSCGDAPPRARPALGFTGAQYEPRRPEETVLHDLVREHLGAFLGHARDTYEKPLPRYVEKAFHEYLRCGVFAHGFLRFHCDDCGGDLLVAFSCKGRGVCPRCGQRRMCNTAAHLVDRVLPSVPARQWVLSLPFELRRTAAFGADVATALGRIFIDEVAAHQKHRAGISGAEHGAVNFLQRFGGSLNLNLHFHAMVLDGVFTRDEDGTARFDETGAPTQEALQRIVRRVRDRSVLGSICKPRCASFMFGSTGLTHEATRTRAPTSTTHIRHTPTGRRRSSWQRTGIAIPIRFAASRSSSLPGR